MRCLRGTPPASYGFAGQRYDSDNNLHYFNACYYDPVGRQFANSRPASPIEHTRPRLPVLHPLAASSRRVYSAK